MLSSATVSSSCGGRHEKHGVLCHRLIENRRRVGAQHAARGRTRLVDAVVADAEARDDSARRQRIIKRPGVLTAAHDDVANVQIANSRSEIVLGSGARRQSSPRAAMKRSSPLRYSGSVTSTIGFMSVMSQQNLPLTPIGVASYSPVT